MATIVKPELFQFSVVVPGRSHNPTLLNPDFLQLRGIVPAEWNWKAADTVTTPPFALVRYDNGVTVQVELDKLSVVNLEPGDDPTKTRVADIARSFVKTLPHVRYNAVGVNFQSILRVPGSPGDFIKSRFISEGPWDGPKRPLEAGGIRLVYSLGGDARVTLSIDVGMIEVAGQDPQRSTNPVVFANANFHRPCTGYPAETEVLEHLDNLESDWRIYQELIADALVEEK